MNTRPSDMTNHSSAKPVPAEEFFILQHPADNVLICRHDIRAGTELTINSTTFRLTTDIEIGHKIASQPIAEDRKIIRYGTPIGSATSDIAVGEHVHLHNMKSDYIPSHTRAGTTGIRKD